MKHGLATGKLSPALTAAVGLLLAGHGLLAFATPKDRPLVIAPVIEGLLVCDARPDNEYRQLIHADSQCAVDGRDGVKAAASLLNELEPGGPKGAVQVGYTVTVQLLSLYRQNKGKWQIEERRVRQVMDVLNRLKRPAVLYLAANHFDTPGAITSSLEADPANLMHLADGSVPYSTYFGYKIVPYTLLTDESIPVNRLRFNALRKVASHFAALPKSTRDRVVAVTLAGEVHQMFSNFEGGMGSYDPVSVTDYSAGSQKGFRTWLSQKYGSIQNLNEATGGSFASFDAVHAPFRNVLIAPGDTLQHFDGFAEGRVPVSGWLWDPARRVTGLELQVDGKTVAQLPREFNRLDVYRALEPVDDPSVGFRHDIDFSQWRPGEYVLQVVARSATQAYELGRSVLEVSAMPGKLPVNKRLDRVTAYPAISSLPGIKASLDLPKARQKVLFNPLARDWNSYREWQVNAFIAKFHQVALRAGFPSEKLFSHQILPRVNSSWNPQFFGTDESVDSRLPWKQGFNTYGGAAGGAWTARFIAERQIADYGVPEFHQQQWKRPEAAREALAMHRKLGARFIGPYYLSIIADRQLKTGANLNRLEIRPNNSLDGSDQLYRAIKEISAQ